MNFNVNSGLHIISILATTLLVILITKIIFAIFPVKTDRRKVINSFSILLFFILLNYINIYKYLPWFNNNEYFNALKTLIALFSTMLFTSSLDYFIWNGIAKRGNKPGVPKILTNILKFLIYFIVLLFCANQIYGMQITTLLASAGLLTFILGYASKETLSNFFAGVAVQLGGKLKKGHHITAGSNDGVIIEFNWRSTTIQGFRTMVIPNSQISNDDISIHNYELDKPYMASFTIPTAIYVNHVELLELFEDTIKECSPLSQGFAAIYESKETSVDIVVIGMVQNRSQIWPMKSEFQSAIRNKANKANLFIGAPRILKRSDSINPIQIIPPEPSQILETLNSSSIFSKISEQDAQNIIHSNEIKYFVHGENVINQNATGDSMFIILEGEFHTYEAHKGVKEKMRTLETANVFGLKAFLLAEPRRITVRCQSRCGWLLEISREKFKEAQEHYQSLLDNLSAILVERETENLKTHQSLDAALDMNEDISKIILNKIANLFHKQK